MTLTMAITIQFLDELRAKTRLSDLIQESVPLTRSGKEWKACCPFHAEKTPSFTVNDEKGFYHCFGCGAHGDAIKWLTEKGGMDFKAAVSRLALLAGLKAEEGSQARDAPSKPAEVAKLSRKSSGGKLNRSETVTVRLDPKLNYLCELAARAHRRTKSSYIEWAVAESLNGVALPNSKSAGWAENIETIKDRSEELWHVEEADRLVSLALISPELLTHDEQLVWRLVKENGLLWRGRYDNEGEWVWVVSRENLIRDRLRKYWDLFILVSKGDAEEDALPNWAKTKPSDPDDDLPF